MNNLFNEVFGTLEERKTPIEIALGVDEAGRTTAKRLYSFLDLNPGNFSRWCKTNITDNKFAEENIDYLRFFIDEETPTGGKVRREDYKLTAGFAKKLSMMQKNQKGEAARNYFVGVEDGAKKLVDELPCPLDHQVAADVAKLGNTTVQIMTKQGSAPYKIAEVFYLQCQQFGIHLPADFVKKPEYEQIELFK